eukprot:3430527-Prymnesium_polylepis.1
MSGHCPSSFSGQIQTSQDISADISGHGHVQSMDNRTNPHVHTTNPKHAPNIAAHPLPVHTHSLTPNLRRPGAAPGAQPAPLSTPCWGCSARSGRAR